MGCQNYIGGLVLIGNTLALQVRVRGSIPLSSTKIIRKCYRLGERHSLENCLIQKWVRGFESVHFRQTYWHHCWISIYYTFDREWNWQTSAFIAGQGTVLDKAFVGSKPTGRTDKFIKYLCWQTVLNLLTYTHSFAPVTELVYVLVLEAKFWEFESLLGHHIKAHWS